MGNKQPVGFSTGSGKTAIQVVGRKHGRTRVIKHIRSASCDSDTAKLVKLAERKSGKY